MSIVQTITNGSEFYEWLQQSDNYKNNFSYKGANALQEYLDDLSDEIGQDIEFDPIAWCCEYTEYESVKDAYTEHYGDDGDLPKDQRRTTKAQQLEYFQDNTTVIEFDGGIVIQDF